MLTRQFKLPKITSLSQTQRMIVFGLIFAVIGTVFVLISQATTTSQTFSGKLTSRQQTQSYDITPAVGQLNATLITSSNNSMSLALVDSNGNAVAFKTGRSPLTLSFITQSDKYKLQVSSLDPISSKGLAFSLQTSYETAPPPPTGDATAPTAPSNLKATANSGSQVTLIWGASTDNVGVVGYDIYRDSVKIGSSPSTTYQDTGLTAVTTYKYYIIAKDAAGNASRSSSSVRIKTLGGSGADTTPPTIPTNFTAAYNNTYKVVELDWTQSTDNSTIAPHYDIHVNGSLKHENVTQPPYSDYGLTGGSTYSYYVVARDNVGNLSGPSNSVSITIPVPDTEKPSTPTNLTATPINSKQINLSWAVSTDNVGTTDYYVYANGALVRVLPSTEYIHNNLTSSTNYSYYVIASDAAGNKSDPSATVVARTSDPDTEKPTIPGNFTVSASSSSKVDISWIASTDNVGVVGYKIYRNNSIISTLSPSTTNFTDADVKPNEAYWYAVEAFDNERNVSKTNEKRVYTPSAINIVVASPTSGSTVSGMVSVSGIATTASGQITKVEVAGSYGNYQMATGTSSWTATIDTTKIPDSLVNDDPGFSGTSPSYIFIKATDESTGDFKITPVPIIVGNDTVPPTTTILSPASGSSQAGYYTISGTATDNKGVKKVEIMDRNGQGGQVLATGTTNWTAVVTTENDSFYPFDTVVVHDVNGNKSSTPFIVNKAHQTYNGTISGRTYKDQNNNRTFDQGDEALSGHQVYLYTSTGGYGQFMKSAISDTEGKFSFGGLQDGNYKMVYSASSWWTLDDNWFSNNPSLLRSRSSPSMPVSLNGSANADFSWRPIGRTPNPDQAGTFSLLVSLQGPNGLTAKQYDDAILAQEIYDRTSAGKLIGEEANKTSVSEGNYFGGGFAGTTSASYATDSNGKCSSPQGSSSVYWPYWYDNDEGTLFHEYGHSWENYWSCLHQDKDLTEYMVNRGLDLTDTRLHTNHMWSLKEIAAEDYRQLFSANPDVLRQENNNLPKPTEIPGFKDYLTNVYRTPR